MSLPPVPLTTEHRIVPGEELRRGAVSPYRGLAREAGEAHLVRTDLTPDGAERWHSAPARRPLLCLAHLTDLQLADVSSPLRFEFFNREAGDPRFAPLIPTHRPYEAFLPRTVAALVATLNRVGAGPVGGAPVSLALSTGDAIDNAQANEVRAVLALLDGGTVEPAPGGRYEGVQRPDWPDDVFWLPDGGRPGAAPDLFRAAFGYPGAPGAIAAAVSPFAAPGLAVPWLAAYGNHEGLIQGVGRITPELAAALVGGRKPSALPAGLDRDAAYELFVSGAQAFLDAPSVGVTASADRRPLGRRDFVAAHFGAGARPVGHGFTERNRRDGTAYYAFDVDAADPGGRYAGLRLIALDTACLLGGADGAIDIEQVAWLETVLRECHSTYLGPDGVAVEGRGQDRLVILFSHHGLDTMTNPRGGGRDGGPVGSGPDGHAVPVVPADSFEALLYRYPNVVLWLNGHTHTNAVRPRVSRYRRPDGTPRGFWEVTTCSVMDWPCQGRLVELIDLGDADRPALAVACTMVDHDSPLAPAPVDGRWRGADLSALHRELAANVPIPGYGERLTGTAADRNVILPLPVGR